MAKRYKAPGAGSTAAWGRLQVATDETTGLGGTLRRIPAPTSDPGDPARYWAGGGSDIVEQQALRDLFDYWRAKRGAARLPARGDIDALEIPWALDRIYLIDRVPPPATWRYRLAGGRIEETFGVNSLRGLALGDFLSADKARLIIERWQPLIERGCAVYMKGMIYRTAERCTLGGRLLLPLGDRRDATGAVTGLLGLTDGQWRRPEAAGAPPPLDIHYLDLSAG